MNTASTPLATYTTTVPATPAQLFARWADCDTHPEWSTDLAWVRLDEPVRLGATGRLRPKGGPRSRFTVTELVPDRTFADTTHLAGARLTFRHHAEPAPTGSRVTVTVSVDGPLRGLWARVLGGADAVRRGVEKDLANLLALVAAPAVAPEVAR
ncbi:SRPBCC family protein [Intrasporangium flavum]|uniref:SRPBCC family protein n=1 Tax=Intrasporangium flavum TaxID=1428657 RepID=UPI00096D09BC|nr:SRPBCC family protein [Intrasporangium flavum]